MIAKLHMGRPHRESMTPKYFIKTFTIIIHSAPSLSVRMQKSPIHQLPYPSPHYRRGLARIISTPCHQTVIRLAFCFHFAHGALVDGCGIVVLLTGVVMAPLLLEGWCNLSVPSLVVGTPLMKVRVGALRGPSEGVHVA